MPGEPLRASPLTRAKLVLGFDWLYQRRDEHFGNGRLVRNTFENSVRRLANRVAAVVPVTRELLTVFTPDDVHLGGIPEETWQAVDDSRMRFALSCDACGQPIRVRVRQLGRHVGCPHCESSGTADWGDPVWPAPKEGAGRNGQTA